MSISEESYDRVNEALDEIKDYFKNWNEDIESEVSNSFEDSDGNELNDEQIKMTFLAWLEKIDEYDDEKTAFIKKGFLITLRDVIQNNIVNIDDFLLDYDPDDYEDEEKYGELDGVQRLNAFKWCAEKLTEEYKEYFEIEV